MPDFVQHENDNGVGIITLDRPEANNALHAEAARELWEATTELGEDPDVRAIVLRANGKMFCSGGDLKYMVAKENRAALAKALKVTTTYFHAAISRLTRGNAPVVMAVQGAAAGGGFSLALAGDIVIAAESAKFKMAYTASGISPDGGSTWFLPRLVGMRVAQKLALENPTLTAREAVEINLISEVVPDDELEKTVMAKARRFADGPTCAFGSVKSLFAETWANGLEQQMELETLSLAASARTADMNEGLTAFSAKRTPVFKGK
ncbi:MAG: enoyl-CoA hydratase-related protein [Rhodospirillaceae bacterium]|nr:enoyl-CoA hydratase-related protein [Rhodospirillaceae bacterium]MCY4238412.1 enoyl-CoA hydratase-related protein [Rhodospirillaceae bacterium]